MTRIVNNSSLVVDISAAGHKKMSMSKPCMGIHGPPSRGS